MNIFSEIICRINEHYKNMNKFIPDTFPENFLIENMFIIQYSLEKRIRNTYEVN